MIEKLQEAVNAVILAKGNKSDAARALNIPRTTLLTRLDAAEREGVKPTVKSPNLEVALAEQNMVYDLQIRDLKKQLDEAILQNVTSDYVRKNVFKLGKHNAKPPKWVTKSSPATGAPGVPTLFLSDFHYGEVVRPEAVNKLNTNTAIGAASIHKNQTANPPKIAPKLFPLPPTITITNIKNVYLIGR